MHYVTRAVQYVCVNSSMRIIKARERNSGARIKMNNMEQSSVPGLFADYLVFLTKNLRMLQRLANELVCIRTKLTVNFIIYTIIFKKTIVQTVLQSHS